MRGALHNAVLASPILLTFSLTALSATALVDKALEHSPDVARAAAELEVARAALEVVSPWLPNPRIGASTRTDALSGARGEGELGFDIAQVIPFPGVRLADVDSASARVHAAELRLAAAKNIVAGRVLIAASSFAAAREVLTARTEQADVSIRVASGVATRTKNGLASPLDENLASLDAAAASGARAQAKAALGARGAELCASVGDVDGVTTCNLDDVDLPALPTVDPQLAAVGAKRQEIGAADAEVVAAEKSITARELERIPAIEVSVGWTRSTTSLDVPSIGRVKDPADLLGASISIPLPLFSLGGGGVAVAHAVKSARDADARAVRVDVAKDVESARIALEQAREAAQGFARVAGRVDESLHWSLDGYDKGSVTLEQLLATRDRLSRIRLEALDAQRAEREAHIHYLVAIGAPLYERSALNEGAKP